MIEDNKIPEGEYTVNMPEESKTPKGEYISTSARRFYGIVSGITGVALIFSTLVCYSRGSQLESQGRQIKKLETEIQYRKQIHSLDSTTIKNLERIFSERDSIDERFRQQRDSLERSFHRVPQITPENQPNLPHHNI